MDYKEEQSQELEALKSIYDADFLEESPTSFGVRIVPDEELQREAKVALRDPKSKDEDGDVEEDEGAEVVLHVTLPDTYPEVVPDLELQVVRGIHTTEEDEAALSEELNSLAAENLGMAMVFTLASHLKDRAEEILRQKVEDANNAREERLRLAEEAERKRVEGTKVTPESFRAWRQKFEKEVAELAKLAAKGQTDPKKLKPTGRQLFEQNEGLAKSDLTMIEAGDVTVDVDLFELEDLNLSDEGDEDEDNAIVAALRNDD